MGVGSRGDNVHNLWRVLLRILGLKVTHLVMSVAREVPLSILLSRGPAAENTADWRPRLPHPGTHCCIQVRPCFALAAPRQWQSTVGVEGPSCFCLTQGSSYGKLALREFKNPSRLAETFSELHCGLRLLLTNTPSLSSFTDLSQGLKLFLLAHAPSLFSFTRTLLPI